MANFIVAKKIHELAFGKLMEVYEEGNLKNGRELYPEESESRQIALAEQDFYQYLQQIFFRTPGAVYYVLEEGGRYISALRLEPYRDGMLLEALETAPNQRRKGYAAKLLMAVLEQVRDIKIYSHVHKKNAASLRVHESCGFRRIMESAVYADGSADRRCCTLLHD